MKQLSLPKSVLPGGLSAPRLRYFWLLLILPNWDKSASFITGIADSPNGEVKVIYSELAGARIRLEFWKIEKSLEWRWGGGFRDGSNRGLLVSGHGYGSLWSWARSGLWNARTWTSSLWKSINPSLFTKFIFSIKIFQGFLGSGISNHADHSVDRNIKKIYF